VIERSFIQEGVKHVELDRYLSKELDGAGFAGVEIQKTPLVTRVILSVTKAGMVIGKKGQNIKRLTRDIEEKFKIDNPQLEIRQIERPELNARAMVAKMVSLLNRGFSWRSISYRIVRDIISAGAMGVEIRLAGKLGGKGARKMRKRLFEGYMKKAGDEVRLVDYAKGPANTKGGVIGIKIRIVRPGTVFKDKLTEESLTKEVKAAEEKPAEKVEAKTEEVAVEKSVEKVEKKERKPRKNKEEKPAEGSHEKKAEAPVEVSEEKKAGETGREVSVEAGEVKQDESK
jgi:small subunit ribosomal protein S3